MVAQSLSIEQNDYVNLLLINMAPSFYSNAMISISDLLAS